MGNRWESILRFFDSRAWRIAGAVFRTVLICFLIVYFFLLGSGPGRTLLIILFALALIDDVFDLVKAIKSKPKNR